MQTENLMSQIKSSIKKVRTLPYSKLKVRTKSKTNATMSGGLSESVNRPFSSGVVEGFYGRPWTFEQRKELFVRMRVLGMSTYLYAPKDDLKHRAKWRELYNLEESENLRMLISCAKENGVAFYYALSPGLDIIFSSAKDVQLLKKKMEQLQGLGCEAFSLLFDDIDPELKFPDENIFSHFGDAQVKLTNEMYHHLKCPKFLFCPTEYCATRAVPNVETSQYLSILGNKLESKIDIMWTGPKVISQHITPESIQTLSRVLKRKPVIWDNIHANDYDQRRVFLGPYHGRPVELYKHLNGILTNPNCEFESNFIAIHTLATWVRCAKGESAATVDEPMNLDPVTDKVNGEHMEEDPIDATIPDSPVTTNAKSADVKVDVKADEIAKEESPMETDNVVSLPYDPDLALKEAVLAWLLEFQKEKHPSPCPYAKSGPYSVSTTPPVQKQAPMCTGTNTTNSVSPVCTPSAYRTAKQNSRKRMNIAPSLENIRSIKEDIESLMDVAEVKPNIKVKVSTPLQVEDLMLLVDLFYLPYNHGIKARHFITEFKWLKAHAINEDNEDFKELTEEQQKTKLTEWKARAEDFHQQCQAVSDMFVRFSETPNRALLYDIYPYLWDIKESISLLDTFVTWLNSKSRLKKQRPNFYPEDPEPWVFRGGLCGELQRLLPVDSNTDMYSIRAPDVPTTCVYTIRPFQPEDEKSMYEICLSTCDDGEDGHDLFSNEPSMAGDRFVGPYISICPEHVFVVEDSEGVCGYAVSTPDAATFYNMYRQTWCPEVRKKYTRPSGNSSDWTYSEHIADEFHIPKVFLPDELYSKHKAKVRLDLLPRARDHFLAKRLMMCVLSALKSEGCTSVYSEINVNNSVMLELYCRLGFYEVMLKQVPEDHLIYGRNF
ncbi:protein O-GlcNAcase [Nematostella vectensis]|uniref:protein O-GlcNAcase n=1 Tax=Nematostella vectensis TaxID=45351 RepID=UPI00138FFA5B|nr:protein O-GlcNAcase [Nematostella vectensis]